MLKLLGDKKRVLFWVGCLVILVAAIVVKIQMVKRDLAKDEQTSYRIRMERGIPIDAFKVAKGSIVISERFSAKKVTRNNYVAEIPLNLKNRLQVGMNVLSGKKRGKISHIEDRMRLSTGMFTIRISLKNENISVGDVAIFDVQILTLRNVYSIPSVSVIEMNGGKYVWVINDNIVKLKKIKVGKMSEKMIIVKKGLTSGMLVVIHGVNDLDVGSKVYITNKELL